MRYLLVGNYGVGNLGDELLREYFLVRFGEVEWTVVSASPKGPGEVPRLPGGVRSLFWGKWRETLQSLRTADGLVFGGGTLFTDIESPRACFLWWLHAAAAVWYRKPVYLAFQGVGPFRTKRGEWFSRWVFRKSVFISVRDSASADRVKKWGTNTKIVHSFDPAFLLLSEERSTIRTKNVLTVIPRFNSSKMLRNRLKILLEEQAIDFIAILCFQYSHAAERKAAEKLKKFCGKRAWIVPIADKESLMEAMYSSTFVITERYHGAIAAIAAHVPLEILSQGNDDKLASLKNLSHGRGFNMRDMLVREIRRGEDALRLAMRDVARAKMGSNE